MSTNWIKPNATKKFDNTIEGREQAQVARRIARRHFNDVHMEFKGYETILYTGSSRT